MALFHWLALHLATLDGLDGGARAAGLRARPALLGAVQPLIADGLIGSGYIREPEKTFSLFTWINEGGLVMDRLIAGCQQGAENLGRISTDVTSVSGLAQRLNLSRTQLGRNLPRPRRWEASAGPGRGESLRCGLPDFRREYHAAQAVKLAFVDAAFEAVSRMAGPQPVNRRRRNADLASAAAALLGLAVLVVLGEERPEVGGFRFLLDAGEDHLGAGILALGSLM